MAARITIFAICLYVVGCALVAPTPVEGFGGYAFHSGYTAIKADMARDGYSLADADDRSLWYDGTLYGFSVQFAYDFSHGELAGGYVEIHDLSVRAWEEVGSELDDVYPGARSLSCSSDSEHCRVLCTVDAKIIHLLTKDREVHVIRYYERAPQNDCYSDRRSN